MIAIKFEGESCVIHYQPELLGDLEGYIIVENLPELTQQEGKTAILSEDANHKLFWEYRDTPKAPNTTETQVYLLQEDIKAIRTTQLDIQTAMAEMMGI